MPVEVPRPITLITTATAAELTRVPLAQFRRWQARNDGPPAVRMAGCYFYRLTTLTAWLARWWRPRTTQPLTHDRPWPLAVGQGS